MLKVLLLSLSLMFAPLADATVRINNDKYWNSFYRHQRVEQIECFIAHFFGRSCKPS